MISNAKKIAIFLPALYGGGAERTMLNLAQGIHQRGHDVELVLAQAEGPYMAQLPPSLPIVDLARGQFVSSSRTFRSLPALMRYLRRQRPDAMLSSLTRANVVALCARRLTGTPQRLVVNEQNTFSHSASQSQSPFARWTPSLVRHSYRWADRVVGVSQGVADDLIEAVGIPQHLIDVIYNPGVTPELRHKAQAPVGHSWLQPGQPPVVLAVGSLTRQKDFDTLLRAFARLRQARVVRLLILGEGPERQQLEKRIQQLNLTQDVSLPGFVENPFAYMRHAALFVMSSRWEGLPTVLVEALYCGIPLVATDCPSGPREILKNGKFGCLVPVGQPAELAQAMTTVLDGKGPRPTHDSYRPFELETSVTQYLKILLGDDRLA